MNYVGISSTAMTALVVMAMSGSGDRAIAQPAVDCKNAQTTVEMKFCSQKSYKEADRELNTVYQQVLKGVTGEQKRLLISAEEAWIRLRDNHCNFEVYQSRGGTGYEVFRNGCLERMTRHRTAELEAHLNSR